MCVCDKDKCDKDGIINYKCDDKSDRCDKHVIIDDCMSSTVVAMCKRAVELSDRCW